MSGPRSLLRAAWPWWLLVVSLTAAASWLPLLPTLGALFSADGWNALRDPRLGALFLRTLWLSALASGIAMGLGVPYALLATRTNVPGAALFALLMPLPLLLPPLLIAQAWHGLTGMDGQWAAVLCLGLAGAPLPALLTAHALARQAAGAHEAALLCGGPRFAAAEMLRSAWPAALLGGVLAFLFAAADFSVPDYMSFLAEEKFFVYSFEIFNRSREADFRGGAAAAAPLVLVIALLLYASLHWRDAWSGAERAAARPAPRLRVPAGRWLLLTAALAGAALLLLLPLGRILYDTGMAGPAATEAWLQRSARAFSDALARGRGDLLRSLQTGALAGALVLLLAPWWAAQLLRLGRRRQRLLFLLLALPLLAPGVGFGMGAIVVYNRDLFGGFYDSALLPPLLMAGRWLPLAVFLLAERLQRVPANQEEAAQLAGAGYRLRLFRYRLGVQRPAWWLAAALVAVFAVREIDLAILLPAANQSAAVRYYMALHAQRDNFVAAFGLVMALVLFLPLMLEAAWRGARARDER
ncbi:MAG: hypothetical protein EYC70_04680 [Planctomycetota bacterium]|nr:MAG: hypothetical protein EYC70_04680 [Planctomycetota bacterium]